MLYWAGCIPIEELERDNRKKEDKNISFRVSFILQHGVISVF